MKNATAKATIWSLLDNYAGFALKFVFAIAITRILSPHDYGLVAYMGLFLGIATWLSEGGFGAALIQKKDANNLDYSTAYFFNVILSIFFFLVYFSIAGFVSDFFNEPDLKLIMRITSINLILNSLCYVHLFKLIKSIQFKKQAIINFVSSLISGTIGLCLALIYKNYWALIFQTLTGAFLRMIGYWIMAKWVPTFGFSWISFKEQYKFGSKVFLQGLLESVFSEIHSLVIGKSYQTAALGNYSRGKKFYDLFIVQTGIAFNKVLYPTMAKKTNEPDLHKVLYIKIYTLLFFIMAPISLFLLLLSKPIVLLLLTTKWIEAAPIMQLYLIAGFVYSLVYFNSATILSANKPKKFLIMDIYQKCLIGIALSITFRISINAIVIGWVIAYYLYYALYERTMQKNNYNTIIKYKRMLEVIICLIPNLVFFFIISHIIFSDFWVVLINVVGQPILYLSMMKIFRFQVLSDFLIIAKPLIPIKIKSILKIIMLNKTNI